MKRIIFMIFLCMALMAGYAKRLSHTFDKASFSKVLVWLDKAQPQYKINFIYDELEDFTVSTSFKNKDVRDIVTQVHQSLPKCCRKSGQSYRLKQNRRPFCWEFREFHCRYTK